MRTRSSSRAPAQLLVVADAPHLDGEGEPEQQREDADERRGQRVAADAATPAFAGAGSPGAGAASACSGRLARAALRARSVRSAARSSASEPEPARRPARPGRVVLRRAGSAGGPVPKGCGTTSSSPVRGPRRAGGWSSVMPGTRAGGWRRRCRRCGCRGRRRRRWTAARPTPSWSPRKTISAGDDDVGHEGDDEDLRVEDAVQPGAEAAEDGVQGRDDGDRQVGLQPERDGRVEEEAEQDAGRESEDRDHGVSLPAWGRWRGRPGRRPRARRAELGGARRGQGQLVLLGEVEAQVERLGDDGERADLGAGEELGGQRVRVADGADLVGVGDRPEVDQHGLAGEPDGGGGAQPLAVDADRLGAGGPEGVDHQLQVAVARPGRAGPPRWRRRPGRRRPSGRRWRG